MKNKKLKLNLKNSFVGKFHFFGVAKSMRNHRNHRNIEYKKLRINHLGVAVMPQPLSQKTATEVY